MHQSKTDSKTSKSKREENGKGRLKTTPEEISPVLPHLPVHTVHWDHYVSHFSPFAGICCLLYVKLGHHMVCYEASSEAKPALLLSVHQPYNGAKHSKTLKTQEGDLEAYGDERNSS